jgi:hypothetical protein
MVVAESQEIPRAAGARESQGGPLLAAAFAGTVFVSAFLLFQVQPLVSKAILPWFGGSPAVWTTCMLFFQVALFLGYAYAHAVTRYVPRKAQLVLHLALLAAALVFLPIIPSDTLKPQGSEHPVQRILVLLSLTVGLPYFILSTTGPLLQAWFAKAFPGRSPYRLYALSNIGSLAALLTFPVLFEPAFALGSLAWLWSGLFVVFGLLCAFSAYAALGRPTAIEAPALATVASAKAVAPSWPMRAIWLLLPAWSCMMLLTVMNYVCQDVAPVPLLFVVPLSLYLLTFIIAFDHPRWYNRSLYAPALLVVLFLIGGMSVWPEWFEPAIELGFVAQLVLYFSGLFLICMVCHGELAQLRPAPKYLTEYFLMLSAGGALGGLFVSLVAPRIFTTYFEWNIGLVGSFLFAGALALTVSFDGLTRLQLQRRGGVIVLEVLALLTIAGLIWKWEAWSSSPLYRARNFYGLVSVTEGGIGEPWHYRAFVSGSVRHGRQYVDPQLRREPISYFAPHTGIGQALESLRAKSDARVGVVGMGIGTVATYAEPGDYYRLYEINPEVEHIARKYFTFLEDCRGQAEVILGDARLELDRELKDHGSHDFDLLCLDAFSGDSVPAHLLTTEAFEIYEGHLKPDGILCFNITNSYLDLSGVVQALADKHGFQTRRIATPPDDDKLFYRTDFMLVTKNKAFLDAHPDRLPAGITEKHTKPVLWTDRYSNVFGILK